MLDRDGVGIHFTVEGQGSRTVLLSHGWAASSHMFAGNVAALATGHRVVTWDLRGHGRSDYPTDPGAYATALAVGDMVALLDEVGADRAVVAGHSLGGFLSLELQLAHPERVEALVLVDTGPGFRNAEARAEWNASAERYAARLEAKGLGGLAAGVEQRIDVHRDATGIALAARTLLTQADARVLDSLTSITVPTLVVVGSDDRPFLAGSQYMAAKVPAASLVEIAGAGHAPNLTHAAEFNRHLLAFLSRLDEP